MVDENKLEEEVIERIKEKFSADAAEVSSFPEDPNFDINGVLDHEFQHPKCEILVECGDNINFGNNTLSDQEGIIGLELTIFVRKRTGEDGGKNICRKLRTALTSRIFLGGRFIPADQNLIFYNQTDMYWCYGQQYKMDTLFQLGEDS